MSDTDTKTPEAMAVEPVKAIQPAPEAQVEPKEVPPEPKPKVFTEDEVKQQIASVKGGYEGTVKKLKEDIKKKQTEVAAALEQLEERKLAVYLEAVEAKGGDVDLAKQVVERERAVRKVEQELASKMATIAEQMELLDQAGKAKAAHDFIKQFELDEKALPALLESEDMKAMENKALKLRLEKVQATAQPTEKPSKDLGKKGGRDVSTLGDSEKLGLALEEVLSSR